MYAERTEVFVWCEISEGLSLRASGVDSTVWRSDPDRLTFSALWQALELLD